MKIVSKGLIGNKLTLKHDGLALNRQAIISTSVNKVLEHCMVSLGHSELMGQEIKNGCQWNMEMRST